MVVELALELLEAFPAACWPARVVVLANAGFGSRAFLRGTQVLGFTRVIVGVRHDRILTNGRKLNELKRRGETVHLHDVPERCFYASWCDVKREERNASTSCRPFLLLDVGSSDGFIAAG